MNAFSLPRFTSKIDKKDPNGCWEWTGYLNEHGYGRLKVKKRMVLAHRFAMGDPKGVCVLHRCDNPKCVNPDHLFLGTHADNMRDQAAKGRFNRKGENNGRAKMTEKQAKKVVSLLGTMQHKHIADEIGVTLDTVRHISRGSSWKHLKR